MKKLLTSVFTRYLADTDEQVYLLQFVVEGNEDEPIYMYSAKESSVLAMRDMILEVAEQKEMITLPRDVINQEYDVTVKVGGKPTIVSVGKCGMDTFKVLESAFLTTHYEAELEFLDYV